MLVPYRIAPSTISSLNIGPLTCTSLNATAGLIETTGEVKSRSLTIQNATTLTTASISTAGYITCTTVNATLGSLIGYRLNTHDVEIIPSVVTNTAYVGYTYSANKTITAYPSNNITFQPFVSIDDNMINNANYLVRFSVRLNSGTTSRNLTSIEYGITNTGSTSLSATGFAYEPSCWNYQKLNPGTEVITNRIFQGSGFFRFITGNAYTFCAVVSFSGEL